MPETQRIRTPQIIPWLFFISGFAALIYQVVWQRVLFTTFGINIESVTVVVSVFMFGLGLGALAGGWLQKRLPERLLECFMAVEIAIGLFGLFSIQLIHWAGSLAPPDSLLALVLIVYALLAFPTMLMGATLPLLVTYLQRALPTLGQTVGTLYAYNTLGSALAAFLTVQLLFVLGGQQSAIIVAVCCNVITALLVFFVRKRVPNVPAAPVTETRSCGELSFNATLLLSGVIGFVALSLEILWFRLLGFLTGGKPQIFGLMLAIFLGAVAAGSLKATRLSQEKADLRRFITQGLLGLLVIAYLSLPLIGAVSGLMNKHVGLFLAYLAIGGLAYCSGGIFPALCQMGIIPREGKSAGGAVAWMYFCNIVGATLGSLITGFVLLDLFTLQENLTIACAVLLLPLMLAWRWSGMARARWTLAVTAVLAALWLHPLLHGRLYEQLQSMWQGGAIVHAVENRSGIITVEENPHGDILYGTGVYDGRFNIDPAIDSNGITRFYMLAGLHPRPERVLQIGLASGSALKVLTMYRPVREIISVEINPGYVEVIEHYPDIASALRDPRAQLVIDDGRRWLNRNPDEKFDAIVMNTSYYWRSHSTNLLSREFLELCKRHLKPGGIVYYNTTGARDIVYTAAHVFKHVVTYWNFVAAGDSPFNLPIEARKKNLLTFVNENGQPLFNQPRYRSVLEKLSGEKLPDIRDSILAEKDLWLITDDNMAVEYKVKEEAH